MQLKMQDIAKLANVSKSAVSIALSGKPGISKETREKILCLVRETGYFPKSMMKAEQVYGASKTISIIVCTNSGIVLEQYYNQPFFMELIHHIDEQARALGYSLLFSSIDILQFDLNINRYIKENNANGILLLGTNLNKEQILQVAQIEPHLVVLDTCFEMLDVNFIVMNNAMGAYQAGIHLVGLGHSDIGYVQSNSRMYNFDSRKKGFMSALNEVNLSVPEENLFSISPTMLASQEDFKDQLLQHKKTVGHLPTALFCECDYIAISVNKSLAELGIRVPEDISLIGFDNISETRIVTPELTTIHVDKERMASIAVKKLIDMIENKDTVTLKSFVDTTFIERNSCQRSLEKSN
jgi:DNA-binding LacI/PurR family transcriptional regulator